MVLASQKDRAWKKKVTYGRIHKMWGICSHGLSASGRNLKYWKHMVRTVQPVGHELYLGHERLTCGPPGLPLSCCCPHHSGCNRISGLPFPPLASISYPPPCKEAGQHSVVQPTMPGVTCAVWCSERACSQGAEVDTRTPMSGAAKGGRNHATWF